MAEESWGSDRARRAAVRDFHRQGRRGNSVAGRRRRQRDQGQRGRDVASQQRRRGDRRSRRRGRFRAPPQSPAAAPAAPSPAPAPAPAQPAPASASAGTERTGAAPAPHAAGAPRRTCPHPASWRSRGQPPRRESSVCRRSCGRSRASITSMCGTSPAAAPAGASRRPTSWATSRPVRPSALRHSANVGAEACGSPATPVQRRRRRARADDRDAAEDRRAHGDEPPHVGARALGVRDRLHQGRRDPEGQEGRVREGGRQAHLHVVHHQGRGRGAESRADREFVGRRHRHPVQESTSTSAWRLRSSGA